MMDEAATARRALSPIEREVEAIAAGAMRAARDSDASVGVGEMVSLLGTHSHTMVIVVFSALNMIPGPPGYGGTVALAIIAVALAMLAGRPLRIGGWIGARRISGTLIARMLDRLRWLARLLARLSRPRLEWLAGEAARKPTAAFILVVSLPMVVPIPLINAVPNVGICVISVSRINRDGLGVLVGAVIGTVGLGIAVAAVWAAISLARAVMGM